MSSMLRITLMSLSIVVVPAVAAAAENIGFEWGIGAEGGAQEIGVTTKKADGKFYDLHEKSKLCVLRGVTRAVSFCVTPDVFTEVRTAWTGVAGRMQSFRVQEFEMVTAPYAWDGGREGKAYWASVVADLDVVLASVATLCTAPGAAAPAPRIATPSISVTSPDGKTTELKPSPTITTTETTEKIGGDRCFLPYAVLRKYLLETAHVRTTWDTEATDTAGGGKVPGVFVKMKDNTTGWRFSAGSQTTVDVDLDHLSDANVHAALFKDFDNDDQWVGDVFKPAITAGNANEKKRENALRLLWHSVVSEVYNSVRARPRNETPEWEITYSPGERKSAYYSFQKSKLGDVLARLGGDAAWVKSNFVATNVDARCTNLANAWKRAQNILYGGSAQSMAFTNRDMKTACDEAFHFAHDAIGASGTGNPAKISAGKEIGPFDLPGGKLIIAMELRETQMINNGGKLVWNAGHVTMPNLDQLMVELKKLYP